MIEVMVQVHMAEAEAARDFHAVFDRAREGAEIVIEQDRRPVADSHAAGTGAPHRRMHRHRERFRGAAGLCTDTR